MNKLWKLSEPNSDKIILIKNQTIYKGSPNHNKINKLDLNDESSHSIEKELFSIPYAYIKKIINQEGVKHIKIFFGKDSEEELKIKNENVKNEIFSFLRDDIKELEYRSELPSYFSYGKTQIFAILILTGLFIWSLYYAIEISNGTVYELSERGRPGLVAFIFVLANLGITKLIMGYIAVGGIAIFSLMRKQKSRSERQILKR